MRIVITSTHTHTVELHDAIDHARHYCLTWNNMPNFTRNSPDATLEKIPATYQNVEHINKKKTPYIN